MAANYWMNASKLSDYAEKGPHRVSQSKGKTIFLPPL